MTNARTLRTGVLAIVLGLAGCHYFSTESQINYGLNHYKMGLYDQAIPALMSAAQSLERRSPPDPRLVEVLIALGDMAQGEKRDDRAADFYPRALKAAEALQPTDSTRLRNALVHVGQFYSYHDRAKDAVPFLQRAADISATFEDREFQAIDLDNLASAYQNLKQYDKAIELQLRSLQIANKLPTAKFPTKGTILHNLGHSYMELGQYKEAEQHLKEALAILSAGGPEVEPWRVRTARRSYAELLRKMGRVEEAEKLQPAALQQGVPADRPRPASSAGG